MKHIKSTYFFSFLLLFTAIIWGFGFIAVKNSLDYFTTSYLLAFRFTIGALGMCIIFYKKLRKITMKDLKCGAILGAFLFTAFQFQINALDYTTVGKNAFLTAAYVVIVPFLCWMIKKKRPKMNSILAAFICLFGIAFLSLDSNLNVNFGDVLTLVCAVFYGLHIVFSDTYMENKHDPITLNIVQLSFTALYGWIFGLLTDPFPTKFQTDSIIGILYLGIACTMVAFLFQAIGQKHTSPAVASILLSTESVFGCIFSAIFLEEVFTFKMIFGCIFIFIAIILSDIGIDFSKFFSKKNN